MALRIRLRKQGRTGRPFFRLVVTDCRARRDGKYIEALGWYNPVEADDEKSMMLKPDRIEHWLGLGAQLSECAQSLVKRVAPEVVKRLTAKEVQGRAKAAAKRKARKDASVA